MLLLEVLKHQIKLSTASIQHLSIREKQDLFENSFKILFSLTSNISKNSKEFKDSKYDSKLTSYNKNEIMINSEDDTETFNERWIYPTNIEKMKVAEILDISISHLNRWLIKARGEGRAFNSIFENLMNSDEKIINNNSKLNIDILSLLDQNNKSIISSSDKLNHNHEIYELNVKDSIQLSSNNPFYKSWPLTKSLIISITQKKLNNLNKQNDFSLNIQLSNEEISKIMKLSGFSRKKIMSFLYYINDPSGILKEEHKKTIKNLFNQRCIESNKITSQDIDFLKEKTQCSRQQILDYLKILRDPPGTFTDENRKIIQKRYLLWSKIHNIPLIDLVNELSNITKLSKRQIHAYIYWLHFKNFPQLSSTQKNNIKNIIGLESNRNLSEFSSNYKINNSKISYNFIAKEINSHPLLVKKYIKSLANSTSITKNQRLLIKEYYNQYGRDKSLENLEVLKDMTKLNIRQIKYLIHAFDSNPGIITPSKKEQIIIQIKKLIKTGKSKKEFILKVSKDFDLSIQQVRSIVKNNQLSLSNLSDEQINNIEILIKEHFNSKSEYNQNINLVSKIDDPINNSISSVNQSVTNDLLIILCQKVQDELGSNYRIEPPQMRIILKRILTNPSNKIENWHKDYIEKWCQNNNLDSIKTEEIKHLMNYTGLNANQIHYLLRKIRDQSGIITTESKEYIKSWVINHSPPYSSSDRLELQNKLGLSRQQIYSLLRQALKFRKFINQQNENLNEKESQLSFEFLSEEKQKFLESWYLKQTQPLSRRALRQICQQLEASQEQIRKSLNRLIDPPGIITLEKKIILQKWIENHNKNPTGNDFKILQKELEISKKQMQNILYQLKRGKK